MTGGEGTPVGRFGRARDVADAATLHAWDPPMPATTLVRVCVVTAPALVLGSTQRSDVVDAAAAADAGVDVVRRRSGGGAVLLHPGEQLWVDVVVPHGDRLWRDDVSRASMVVGEAWAVALAPAIAGRLAVHRGGADRRGVGRLVCAAGRGPGEVLVDGRKLVGIAQRRTRDWSRFQCVVHRRFRGDLYAALLGPAAADLDDVVAPLGADLHDDDVVQALRRALA